MEAVGEEELQYREVEGIEAGLDRGTSLRALGRYTKVIDRLIG